MHNIIGWSCLQKSPPEVSEEPLKGFLWGSSSDPYMAHGSIRQWEGKQKCFFFPLREYNPSIPLYPYTWAQPVSLGIPCWSPRRLGDARVESFHKIMRSPEIKKPKTQTTEKTQPKYLIAIPTNGQETLASLNPFKLAQLLDSAAGSKLANVTRLSGGYSLLETSSSKQSAQLQKTELLGRYPSSHLSPQICEFHKRSY